jgi:copper transport protein
LALATICACAVGFLGAPPAAAHARLLGSDPSSGSTLAEAPSRIELRFDDPVEVDLGGVTLTTADRTDIGLDAPTQGIDRTRVEVALPSLDDGTYIALWRVVSEDGHPLQGAITFSVGTRRPVVDDQLVADLLSAGTGSTVVEVAAGVARAVGYGGLLAVVGIVAVALWAWPAGLEERRVRRLATAAWAAATGGAAAQFMLQGPVALGTGLGDALSPSLWTDVASTVTGRALLGRVLVLGAVWLALARPRPVPWAVLSGLALAVTAAAGHAAGGGGQTIVPILVASAHLAVGAWWLGGLALLVLVALPHADDSSLVRLVRRFSPVALGAVIVLAATGTVQAVRQSGSIDALASTTYGQLLGTKVVLVGVMVVVASWSRTAVRQHERAPVASLVGAGSHGPAPDGAPTPDGALRSQLRRTVGVESVLAIAVIAVTAILVDVVPAKDDLSRPVESTSVQSGVLLELLLTPGRVGGNEVHLAFGRTDGGLADPTGAVLRLVDVNDPDFAIDVDVRADGPGHFRVDSLIIPRAGQWRLQVVASDEASSQRFVQDFEILG